LATPPPTASSNEIHKPNGKHIDTVNVMYVSCTVNHLDLDDGNGKQSLLVLCEKWFSEFADVLILQDTEKTRSMAKYLAELSAKAIPSRFSDGRGKCAKYPALFFELFKLSIASTDGTPTVLMTENALANLNNTVGYLEMPLDMSTPPVAKKLPKAKAKSKGKRKAGATEPEPDIGEIITEPEPGFKELVLAAAHKKVGINRLDQIEIAVTEAACSITPWQMDPKQPGAK
jgi:hypothetical protein